VRNLDFTSWQTLLSTLLGLSVIALIGVGIRLLAMQTIQQRRERENRQINERLRTLIAGHALDEVRSAAAGTVHGPAFQGAAGADAPVLGNRGPPARRTGYPRAVARGPNGLRSCSIPWNSTNCVVVAQR
jgi:hypothetical protein